MTDNDKLKKLKKLADAMYYAAKYLTTDASRLHRAMDEYHKFIIHECKEEPVSEELEEASKNHAVERFRTTRDKFLAEKCKWSFKAGAQWQKQQMMAKAVEGGCFSYKNGFVHISCDVDEHLTDVKFGDKVKVIVIKED